MANAQTETWFFPTKVHLRLRDQSLLKFPPGPRDVSVDLPEEEKAILRRHGAKPIEAVSKQASGEAESASGASQEGKGGQGKEDTGEGFKSETTSTKKVSKK